MTKEIKKLLDKLYNLRGADSVVLAQMDEEKAKAEQAKERTTSEIESLNKKIEELDSEEKILTENGEQLVNALKSIQLDGFSDVLEKLSISFNPDKLSEEVSEKLPKKLEEVKVDSENAKNELLKVETEMKEAEATISELDVRKDEALNDQARLNEFFDLSLNGNINITRDSITSLLAKFDFSEEEKREAAKILMFPEDSLYEYEKELNNAKESGKSFQEVFQAAKENVKEDVVETESKLSPKDELIKILTDLGFDYLDFTNNDLEKILINYNENDLRSNVNYAKENNVNLDLFVDNVELLFDKKLIDKVNKLLSIGKDIKDIYLYPTVLVKYSYEDLDKTIEGLRNNGLDPKMIPLIAY